MKYDFLYSVEKEYPVALSTLWDAWVDPVKLQAWYHPTTLNSLPGSAKSELVIEGLWSCAIDVPAYNYVAYFYGKYTQIVPQKYLEHTMHYTQSAEEFKKLDFSTPYHIVKVDFEDRGKSSWVKFTQYGQLPDGEAPRAQAGMTDYFESLAQFLA